MHETFKSGFTIKCTPESQTTNAMNYLLTGYPLAGKSLDGVEIEFLDGSMKGKKAVFKTELYELKSKLEKYK